MGLHDRIHSGGTNGTEPATPELPVALAKAVRERARTGPSDPYGQLKTRVHHACIAKIGPELFAKESAEQLNDRVLREVTEQLLLDGTPLTREERRQLVREIADDILGYGPLEPLLREESV